MAECVTFYDFKGFEVWSPRYPSAIACDYLHEYGRAVYTARYMFPVKSSRDHYQLTLCVAEINTVERSFVAAG